MERKIHGRLIGVMHGGIVANVSLWVSVILVRKMEEQVLLCAVVTIKIFNFGLYIIIVQITS